VLTLNADGVLALGDVQYEAGEYEDFMGYYEPSWGRFKQITHPVPGNREYDDGGTAEGYFDYFNGIGNDDGPAGPRDRGYYSLEIGEWLIIALNSNCARVGGCSAGSAQETWLRAQLAAHDNNCTLAFWHHPRFSSGGPESGVYFGAMWIALYDFGAEVVLGGDKHNYERFLPQDPFGNLDPANGITQFVVGTGGKNLTGLYELQENSAAFADESFGVLKLSLYEDSYSWQFMVSAGEPFSDAGTAECHS
jgi:acid phosphatase type 7